MWVGPVTIRSPSALERLAASGVPASAAARSIAGVAGARGACGRRRSRRRRRCRRRSRRCRGSRRATGSRRRARQRGGERGLLVGAAAAEGSVAVRPSVTVVSPPQPSSTHGRRNGRRRRDALGGELGEAAADDAASPSSSVERTSALTPARAGLGGHRLAGARAGDQHHGLRLAAEAGGDSDAGRSRCARTLAGARSQRPWPRRTATASAGVEVSWTLGSVIASSDVAGDVGDGQVDQARRGDARSARRPPLIAETCLRTVLTSDDRHAGARAAAGAGARLSAWLTPGGREAGQRRAAAGEAGEHEVAGAERRRRSSSRRRARGEAALARQRVVGLEDLDPLERGAASPWRTTTAPPSSAVAERRARAPRRSSGWPCPRRRRSGASLVARARTRARRSRRRRRVSVDDALDGARRHRRPRGRRRRRRRASVAKSAGRDRRARRALRIAAASALGRDRPSRSRGDARPRSTSPG